MKKEMKPHAKIKVSQSKENYKFCEKIVQMKIIFT